MVVAGEGSEDDLCRILYPASTPYNDNLEILGTHRSAAILNLILQMSEKVDLVAQSSNNPQPPSIGGCHQIHLQPGHCSTFATAWELSTFIRTVPKGMHVQDASYLHRLDCNLNSFFSNRPWYPTRRTSHALPHPFLAFGPGTNHYFFPPLFSCTIEMILSTTLGSDRVDVSPS